MSLEIRLLDQAAHIVSVGAIDEKSHHMQIKSVFGPEFKGVSIQDMRQALIDARVLAEQAAAEEVKASSKRAKGAAKKSGKICTEDGCGKRRDRHSNTTLCEFHNEVAGLENQHSDERHGGDFENCETCQNVIDSWLVAPVAALNWGKVVGVTERGQKGQPKRVLIACALPGCDAHREIATQDLFQVSHCSIAHKRAHQKLAGS